MNKIFKSYLKTFFKNWLSTTFIFLFLASLSTAIIGILATPVQIYTKITTAEKNSVNFDNIIELNKSNVIYSTDYVINKFYDGNDENDENPLTSTALEILKINSLGNSYNSSKVNLSSDSKKQFQKAINNFFSNFRNGGTNTAFTISVSDLNEKRIDVEKFKNKLFFDHVYKSLMFAVNQIDKNSSSQQIKSAYTAAMYRILLFMNSNNIKSNFINEILSQIVEAKNYFELIKILNDNFSKEFDMVSNGNYIGALNSFLNNSKFTWDTSSDKTKITGYTYASVKDDYIKTISNLNYQYDDRILELHNLFKQIKTNSNRDYEISADRSYALKEGILGTKSFDMRSEFSRKISSDENVSKQNSTINNIIYDTDVSKNSRKTNTWNYDEEPEVIISSAFAKSNNIKVGEKNYLLLKPTTSNASALLSALGIEDDEFFGISPFTQDLKVNVVGIGQSLIDFVPGSSFSSYSQSLSNYAIVYTNLNFAEQQRNYAWNFLDSSESTYTSNFKIKGLNNAGPILPEDLQATVNQEKISVFTNPSKLLETWSDFTVNKTITNLKIRIIIFIVLSVVILILAFIFINFNLKKEINETRKQLGIFKASGYFTSELSWIFALKTFVLFFVGIFVGFFLSMPFQTFAAKGFEGSLTFFYHKIYFTPLFFFIVVVCVPMVFFIISFLSTLIQLNEKPLSLINNQKRKQSKPKPCLLTKMAENKNILFSWRLRKAFIKNSKGKFVIIQVLFAFSSLAFMLIFGAQTITNKVINQGFSVYNSKLDHYYEWNGAYGGLNISDNQEKYVLSDSATEPLNVKYQDISQYQNTNDYLDKNENLISYRYKIHALIQLLNNYYKNLSAEEKVSFLLPEKEISYSLVNQFGFFDKENPNSVQDSKSFIYLLFNYNLNDDSIIQVAKSLKNNPNSLINEKLNFTKEIDTSIENYKSLNTITASELNNIFYNDLLEIFAIKYFQTTAIFSELPNIINNGNKFEKISDLLTKTNKDYWEGYNEFYTNLSKSQFIKVFDPSSSDFWSNTDSNKLYKNSWSIFSIKQSLTDQQIISTLFSSQIAKISSVSSVLQSILMSSNATPETLTNKMINFNSLYFDKTKETLFTTISTILGNVNDSKKLDTYLLSNQFDKYGDFSNAFNFSGISESQMNDFLHPTSDYVPAIIPYFLAKDNNLKIGDMLVDSNQLTSDTTKAIKLNVKVVGINKNETVRVNKDTIYLNREKFIDKYFSDELKNDNIDFLNTLYSQNAALETNLSNSFLNLVFNGFKNVENNLSLSISPKIEVIKDIFKNIFSATENKTDSSILYAQPLKIINNSGWFSNYITSVITPLNILKSTINLFTNIANRIMIVFVLLSAVILAIILLVVIGIVVDEAKATILTMKALGYKTLNVNWVVMGSYIWGLIISFFTAFVLSIIIWKLVLLWVSHQFGVYIFLGIDYRSMLITAPIIIFVLLVGWWAADKQVKKIPLTQITNMT